MHHCNAVGKNESKNLSGLKDGNSQYLLLLPLHLYCNNSRTNAGADKINTEMAGQSVFVGKVDCDAHAALGN